jgi:HlyD family secretion protein
MGGCRWQFEPSMRSTGPTSLIRGLSPKTYEHVTTDDVVISAPNPDLLLEPGMTATIRIVINRQDDILRGPHPD